MELPVGKWGSGLGRERLADGRFPDEVMGRGCWIPTEGRPSDEARNWALGAEVFREWKERSGRKQVPV